MRNVTQWEYKTVALILGNLDWTSPVLYSVAETCEQGLVPDLIHSKRSMFR